MNDYERFFFDLNGYLVVENALDPRDVDTCNEAIDNQREEIHIRAPEESLARGATALVGKQGRGDLGGMLTWPKPWSQPFRDLLAHSVIVPYLDELLGPGFRLDHLYGITMNKGAEGFVLHGGGNTGDLTHSYQYHNGQMRCGLTVVTWVLSDHGPGDGGFACIPGSHKSNYEPPIDVKRLETDLGVVKQVEAAVGSAIIFTEALCHGTLPWKADHERRTVLYKYSPGSLSYSGQYLPKGVEGSLHEFTDEQRAVLQPPYKHMRRPTVEKK